MWHNSKRMAVPGSKAWRRRNQRNAHARIKRQTGCNELPVYKNGGPTFFGQRQSTAAAAKAIPASKKPRKKAGITVPIPQVPSPQVGKAGAAPGPAADAGLAAKLALPIEELDLTVRVYNLLKRDGVNTVGDLTGYTKDALLDIRNFGQKSLDDEVKPKLAGLGLALREPDTA